jgi:hypothetical protein
MLLDKLSSSNVADISSALEAITEDEPTNSENNNSKEQCDVLNEKISC